MGLVVKVIEFFNLYDGIRIDLDLLSDKLIFDGFSALDDCLVIDPSDRSS